MPRSELTSLRQALGNTAEAGGHLLGRTAAVSFRELATGTSLDVPVPELQGRSVLVATRDQLPAALALIELDGIARRLTLVPPDVPREQLDAIVADAAVDVVVTDEHLPDVRGLGTALIVTSRSAVARVSCTLPDPTATEWVLFTSGTTGRPKMVAHSLAGLSAAIKPRTQRDEAVVWGTFYDIRRYGGLQIFLRAVLDGGSLVLSDAGEPTGDFLIRLGRHGVTHLSGTPTHWRRALMSPSARAIAPRYVRLSGEISDQAILDSLAGFYAPARVAHAYASTEAGVGFDVDDGREGFPATLIGQPGEVEMKIVDDTLRVRSRRTASCYVGGTDAPVSDADGFVDTGDIVERIGDRFHFAGRNGGIINVGGLKVHPEEVEAVINRHPQVRMSLVHPRKSPITGALVVADVVLASQPDCSVAKEQSSAVRGEILDLCRARLAQHKVPAMIRFVPALAVAESGKLKRRHG